MGQLTSELQSSADATRDQNALQIGTELATDPLIDKPTDAPLPSFSDFEVNCRSVQGPAAAVVHDGYGVSCDGGEISLTYYQTCW